MKPVPVKTDDTPLLFRTLQKKSQGPVPFWLMRQAGRYLPEYRELRKQAGSFLDLCFTPELATEITLQPIRRFDMDAAILFSDILVIPLALGQHLAFVEGEGPRLGTLDINALAYDETKLVPVMETVRRVRHELAPDKTLIGFAGAPWTVACYMVDGQGGGEFPKTRTLAYSDPEKFQATIDAVVAATSRYLIAQVQAGADVLQIFDSWAGLLPAPEFRRWVIEPTRKLVAALHATCPNVPVIGFPRGAGALYREYAAALDIDGLGLDTQVPLDWAFSETRGKCLQGNLDPLLLLAGGNAMEKAAREILDTARGHSFIFNLGHGVIKETPPEHVAQLARIIREHGA